MNALNTSPAQIDTRDETVEIVELDSLELLAIGGGADFGVM
jgi:hypothetical protein